MDSVTYSGPLATALHGMEGPSGIMDDWSGAALDTTNHRLMVWGGGHNGYYGNEAYAFDLVARKWSMVTQPSDPTGYDFDNAEPGVMADGNPTVIHTYDCLAYSPNTHEMISTAGGGMGPIGGVFYPYTWALNLDTMKWRRRADLPAGFNMQADIISAYDPVSGHIFTCNSSSLGILEYDPVGNTWKALQAPGFADWNMLPDYHMTGAIDPDDRLLVCIGGGYLVAISLVDGSVISGPSHAGSSNATGTQPSGAMQILQANAPGIEWYAPGKCFIAWAGGKTIYTIDPKTWVITAHDMGGDTPTQANGQGTFGRFRYDPGLDLVVVVNSVDESVYLAKPPFGASTSTSATPPVSVTNPDGTTAGPFNTLQEAHDAAQNGATINYAAPPAVPGFWIDGAVLTKDINLVGAPGCKIQGNLVEGGVGALSVHSKNFSIDGIEGFGARGDGSASFVRLQPENMQANFGPGCYFHDNDMAVLTSNKNQQGVVSFSGGTYGGNGSDANFGHAHDLYIGPVGSLTVSGTKFTGCNAGGHCLKSRALKTLVSGCIFDSGSADTSRLIDIPDGGVVNIVNNTLHQGDTENTEIIGIALEMQTVTDRPHSTDIDNNIVSSSKSNFALVSTKSPAPTNAKGNQITVPTGATFSLGQGVTDQGNSIISG